MKRGPGVGGDLLQLELERRPDAERLGHREGPVAEGAVGREDLDGGAFRRQLREAQQELEPGDSAAGHEHRRPFPAGRCGRPPAPRPSERPPAHRSEGVLAGDHVRPLSPPSPLCASGGARTPAWTFPVAKPTVLSPENAVDDARVTAFSGPLRLWATLPQS